VQPDEGNSTTALFFHLMLEKDRMMTEQAAMYMKLVLTVAYTDSNVDGFVEEPSIKVGFQ
jgi:hypothetical protein